MSIIASASMASLLAVGSAMAVGPMPPRALAPTTPPPMPEPGPPRPPPTLTATRATAPIALDGRLDEADWRRASPSDTFTQQYPREGAPPTERTAVRVLYDDRALYIGIDCPQPATAVVPRLTRRDRVTAADRITVDIGSRGDGLTAFHFGVNAAGVLDDGIYFDDNQYSGDWDENWQAATAIRPDGWSVELLIPFQVLRFATAPAHRWGLQVQRYTELLHEWDLWSWRPRSSASVVSSFGALDGLVGIPPPRPVEARVSGLMRLRHRDAGAKGVLAPENDHDLSLGVDAKTHPTQGTTLDLTVNPDFGQVEADQVVLNLSNFEVFYPEKRPFFLEGLDTLSTTRPVLYTRRIGARPSDPTLATGETLVDAVNPSKIWAAGKFVGAATPRMSVGMLSAVAARNVAAVSLDGTTAEREVAPLSIYNVIRARRTFGRAGDLGVLATATNRLDHAPAGRISNDAYVGAIDGRWRSPSTNYVVSGQLIGSLLAQGPARTARDGIAVQPGVPSLGGVVTAAKQGGPNWLGTVTQSVSGRGLDYNDLGYLDRKNDAFTYVDLTYRTLGRWWRTTDTATTLAASHRTALDGIRLEDHLRLSSYATFTSFWAASVTAYLHAPYFDDRETGDGTALERAGLVGAEAWATTDSRRLFTAQLWVQGQWRATGVQAQAFASVVMRPFSRLDCELAPTVLYTGGEPRYVGKDAGMDAAPPTYHFARLEARNLGVTARATIGLLPTLTLQLYSQIFLATKRYSDFSQRSVGGVRERVRLSDLQPPTQPEGMAYPNTEEAALNVNAVLRWEYRLGSLVYLVYTRAQSPALVVPSGATPRLDLGSLGGNRGSTDVVMLKASFWWG